MKTIAASISLILACCGSPPGPPPPSMPADAGPSACDSGVGCEGSCTPDALGMTPVPGLVDFPPCADGQVGSIAVIDGVEATCVSCGGADRYGVFTLFPAGFDPDEHFGKCVGLYWDDFAFSADDGGVCAKCGCSDREHCAWFATPVRPVSDSNPNRCVGADS